MYVAVSASARYPQFLLHAGRLSARRPGPAQLSLRIHEQMPLAVSRVMAEGSLYDPQLAALALKQAAGDVIEAVFRCAPIAPRWSRYGWRPVGSTLAPCARSAASRRLSRTVSAARSSPTYDYTQRLLDFSLEAEREADALPAGGEPAGQRHAACC